MSNRPGARSVWDKDSNSQLIDLTLTPWQRHGCLIFQYMHFVTDVQIMCGIIMKCANAVCSFRCLYLICPKHETSDPHIYISLYLPVLDPTVSYSTSPYSGITPPPYRAYIVLHKASVQVISRALVVLHGQRGLRVWLNTHHTSLRVYTSFITPAYFYCIFPQ